MRTRVTISSVAVVLALSGAALVTYALWPRPTWSPAELVTLRSLWIGSLGPVPSDPSNTVADDPRAVDLGHALFFDTRFSANGAVSCATCHVPEKNLVDNLPLAHGVGTTSRTTMPIAGTQYGQWLFWDGRKDSQWSQALGPMESPVEHGGSRGQYAHLIETYYREPYEALFGRMPSVLSIPERAGPVDDAQARAAWGALSAEDREAVTRIYANMGKAIAAYERRLLPGASRFDAHAEDAINGRSSDALSLDEVAGLRLFIGRANCTVCHMGPLFTSHEFQNTGIPGRQDLPPDNGRLAGVDKVQKDEFNCLSPYSDARPEQCTTLQFMKRAGTEMERQYKVPSLRNVGERGALMHAGQFASIAQALDHYSRAPAAEAGHSELKPLSLAPAEIHQLDAFLRSLSGGINAPAELLASPDPTRQGRAE